MRRAYLFWSPVSQPTSEEDEGALDLGSTVIDHDFLCGSGFANKISHWNQPIQQLPSSRSTSLEWLSWK